MKHQSYQKFKFLPFTLLIGLSSISQNIENYYVENNAIVWSKVFELKDTENISTLKNNLRLNFTKENSGISQKQHCKCKGGSIYLQSPFDYSFIVEQKENRYKVSISNIIFHDNLSINIGSVLIGPTTNTLEEYALKNSDNTIRKNKTNTTNLTCLNDFFIDNFKVKEKNNNW